MNEIYVTGHRNPDTDSIVAALSYAALKNALGEKEYVAVHMGTISDETNRMLKHFGFKPPRLIQNVRTQVRDLDFDRPPCLDSSVTMDRAWQLMRNQKISAIPVTNEDGTLYGMLSAGDIATFSLNTIANPVVEEVPMFNLLSVIEAASWARAAIWWIPCPAACPSPCPRTARICCSTAPTASCCAAASQT